MMVDEFYDRSVNLVIAAEAEPEALYVGNKHAFAFERTVSRLVEMRSTESCASRTSPDLDLSQPVF